MPLNVADEAVAMTSRAMTSLVVVLILSENSAFDMAPCWSFGVVVCPFDEGARALDASLGEDEAASTEAVHPLEEVA